MSPRQQWWDYESAGPITVGSTPVSGGSSGDVLSVDGSGNLGRIPGGVTGTFGG